MIIRYIKPDTVAVPMLPELSLLQSSIDTGNPVPDASEGDASDWGDWTF